MPEKKPENVGVANPYALAEVILARSVAWNRVDDPRELLEKTLDCKYENLFDPKHNSPLYSGLELDTKSKTMSRSLKPTSMVKVASKEVNLESLNVWADPGDFYTDCTEMMDPIQGALGDCYLIAALSSVAWARTYVIAHRTRARNTSGDQLDMIEFFSGGKTKQIEVTEKVPLSSPGNNFIYARSSDKGEIWPAVYEKAYAKWKTNSTSDKPNYAPIAGGDPVRACSELTGLKAYYHWTEKLSASKLYDLVRANSVSRKTFNPMVAWTYPSGDKAPGKVTYSDANLVANHAYSILGWQYTNNKKYIVLRNPWGWKEATLGIDGGNWVSYDSPYRFGPGFWRTIDLSRLDGIFALRADVFKKYFAGLGYVK